MTIIKSLALVLFGTALLMPQTGYSTATKCVKLSPTTTCTGHPVGKQVDWSATCGATAITGISGCSSSPGEMGQTRNYLLTNEDTRLNTNCWCRMTSPAVSRWVHGTTYNEATRCMIGCGVVCAEGLTYSEIRESMFSDFGG